MVVDSVLCLPTDVAAWPAVKSMGFVLGFILLFFSFFSSKSSRILSDKKIVLQIAPSSANGQCSHRVNRFDA